MGICILRMKTLKKYKYMNIYITYVYAYVNIELDFYLSITVCSTNISSVSGSVVIFYCTNLLLFIRILWHWSHYYTCCKNKELKLN